MNDTVTPLTRGQRALHGNKFKQVEYARRVWSVVPEKGTPIEAMLAEGYWAHVAGKLSPDDLIEVRTEDRSWYAELYVFDAGHLWARVVVLNYHNFSTEEPVVSRDVGHEVIWRGPHHRWSVMRQTDGVIVQHGFADRAAAGAWLVDYLKQVA